MASASASKSTIVRPKGLIWDYFHFDKAECYSRCMVNVDDDGKIHECGAKVYGKSTINLKNHLRKHHSDILKELERKENKKKEKAQSSSIIFTNALRLKDNGLGQNMLRKEV